jgi:hypothetical protein
MWLQGFSLNERYIMNLAILWDLGFVILKSRMLTKHTN